MSVVTSNVASQKVTIKNSLGAVVTTLYTDAQGHAEKAIPPGEYIVEVDSLAGYEFDAGTLVESGVSTPTAGLNLSAVTVVSGEDTVVNTIFKNIV